MGLLTPNDIKNFRSLYALQLRYLLSAENPILKGLDSMKQKKHKQMHLVCSQSRLKCCRSPLPDLK